MKLYEIRKSGCEVRVHTLDRKEAIAELKPGCTVDEVCWSEKIKECASLDDARAELKTLRSKVDYPWRCNGGYIITRVTEYYITEEDTEACWGQVPVEFAEFED